MTEPRHSLEHFSAELRERFAADLAAGRTIALPVADLARAEVRENLPHLLESLGRPGDKARQLQIPNYTVLGEIGHGGMSTVYLAHHDRLGRYVALKIVPNWMGGQSRARERLLKEAQAMARLVHANIVTIHDIIDSGDTVAIAMEWVDGLTLAAMLRALPEQAGPDDMVVLRTSLGTPRNAPDRLESTVVRTFVRMMADIARAVHCVHQNGLLHLDIKPSNVLVRRDGTALLADFGVVREIDPAQTHTRSFAGTPIYSAPEQLRRDDRGFGPHTDVYGLGITLYELLARQQPLRHEGLTKVLQDIQAGRIPPLSAQAEISSDLANIVHKAISPNPAHRYASALALANDLEAFLEGRAVTARPLSRTERLVRWMRAEPMKALLVGVLLVLVPTSLALTTKLLSELPRIHTARLRELRVETDRLAQRTIQYLLTDQWDGQDLPQLVESRAGDPDNTSLLGSLLVTLRYVDRERALAIVDAIPKTPETAHGLTCVHSQMDQGRLFFDGKELQELKAGQGRLDTLLYILDRLIWHNRNGLLNSWSIDTEPGGIESMLDQEVLLGEPDPVLLALRAVVAGTKKERTKTLQSLRALTTNWPNDSTIQAWQVVALDPLDPELAHRAAYDFLATHPGDPRVLSPLCVSLLRSDHADEACSLLEKCPNDARLTRLHAYALGELGRPKEGLALLPPEDGVMTAVRLRLEATIDEKGTLRRCDETFVNRLPFALVREYLSMANHSEDNVILERAARRALSWFPDDPQARWMLAKVQVEQRDYEAAFTTVEGYPMPTGALDFFAPIKSRLMVKRKDWAELLATCEEWRRGQTGLSYRLEYYQGLAIVRLALRDRYKEARECFDEHFRLAGILEREARDAAIAAGQSPPKPRHYREAIFEGMWSLLDPELPAESRYPNIPSRHWPSDARSVEAIAQLSPWWALVVAEAHAADGERDKARTWAKKAKELLPHQDPLDISSPADLAQRIDAAIERFK